MLPPGLPHPCHCWRYMLLLLRATGCWCRFLFHLILFLSFVNSLPPRIVEGAQHSHICCPPLATPPQSLFLLAAGALSCRNYLSVCFFVCLACLFIWRALITRHAYATLHAASLGRVASFIKKPKERLCPNHAIQFLDRLMLMRIILGWSKIRLHVSGSS